MTPTTGFIEQQEEEKRRTERAKLNRRMTWLTLGIGIVLMILALAVLKLSWTAIAIISGILLIAAIILDFIEKSGQRREADERAEQIHRLIK